jgi:HK97 family phage major capsid protein
VPTMTDDRLNAEISSANQAATSAWTAFEEARTAVREDPTNGAALEAAESASRNYDAARDKVNDLRRARDLVLRDGERLGQDGNGPTDGPTGFTVGDTMLESLRAHAGALALGSQDYQKMRQAGAFTVHGRKSVEGILIPRKSAQVEGVGEVNLSREALIEAIQAGAMGDMSRMATLVTGTGSSSAGVLVQPQRLNQGGITVPFMTRPLRLVDLITTGRTDSDEVSYVQWSAFTNAAAETAEATAASGSSGTKPESAMDFAEATTSVRTIAHWIPATKRALADAGQLRTLIEQILRLGLDLRLDTQLASGSGSGENIRGIYNTSGIGAITRRVPATNNTATPETILDVVHRAITTVRLAFFEPNAVGIHPTDYEAVRLVRETAAVANVSGGAAGNAGSGQYLMGDPLVGDNVTLWGLRPVVSAAFTQGLPVVGDWTQMVMWLREGTQVLASDSHMDFFIRNLVAILAEFRAAVAVLAPAAFCTAAL